MEKRQGKGRRGKRREEEVTLPAILHMYMYTMYMNNRQKHPLYTLLLKS